MNQNFKDMSREIAQLEMKIKSRIREVKAGTLTPKESGLGILFKRLKELDTASYENLVQLYKLIAS